MIPYGEAINISLSAVKWTCVISDSGCEAVRNRIHGKNRRSPAKCGGRVRISGCGKCSTCDGTVPGNSYCISCINVITIKMEAIRDGWRDGSKVNCRIVYATQCRKIIGGINHGYLNITLNLSD